MSSFFFFQAEDGIRDGHVTGVQTCALPICQGAADKRSEIEELSGQRADTDTEERTRTVSVAVGLRAVGGTAVRVTVTDAPGGALGAMSRGGAGDLGDDQQEVEGDHNAVGAGGAEAVRAQ